MGNVQSAGAALVICITDPNGVEFSPDNGITKRKLEYNECYGGLPPWLSNSLLIRSRGRVATDEDKEASIARVRQDEEKRRLAADPEAAKEAKAKADADRVAKDTLEKVEEARARMRGNQSAAQGNTPPAPRPPAPPAPKGK